MSELASMRIVGLEALKRSLEAKARKLQNRKTVNARAVAVTQAWIDKNFQQQGRLAHPGRGWKELSPNTLMMRRRGPRRLKVVKILQDTGTMRSRWKHFWSAWVAKIQSGVDYAYKHHYGEEGLPVRRVLPTEEQIGPKIKEVFRDFVERVLR